MKLVFGIAGSKEMPKAKPRKRQSAPVTFETVRQLALSFPEVTESTSYGTPAFKVREKLFIRLHQSGESIVVWIDPNDRAMRMSADPETFYITDHYRNYPLLLVRLSTVWPDDLRVLVEESWRRVAPKRLVATYEAQQIKES